MYKWNAAARQKFLRTKVLRGGLILLALLCLSAVLSVHALQAAPEAKTRQADVIVQFDNHDAAVRHITFDTKTISGLDALKRTGLDVVTLDTQFGPAVCSIQGVGMPASNCFGDPQGRFWSYNYWDGDSWNEYQVGAGTSRIKTGAVEGWRWGEYGTPLSAADPLLAGQRALTWLQKQQSATDGGYGGDSATTDTQLAIGANDVLARAWKRNANAPTLQSYQVAHGKNYSKQGSAQAGKLALAASGSRACLAKNARLPHDFYSSNTGAYAEGAGAHAWAMLGTTANNEPVPQDALDYLTRAQRPNGGWEWQPGWGTDTNTTSLALQALVAAGLANNATEITDGLAYLAGAQNQDGGFPYDPDSAFDTSSDANSTAWVIQALYAAGEDPTSGDWTKNANSLAFLATLQLPNGSFEWQAGSGANLLATQQAIPALLGRPFPLRVQSLKSCK